MTTYFLVETNATNDVIATDGNEYYVAQSNPDGTFENTGIDIFAENAVARLRRAFKASAKKGYLYTMSDIKNDYGSDSVYPVDTDFDTFYEKRYKIITIDENGKELKNKCCL